VPGLQTGVEVRGQITPDCAELRYEVDIVEADLLPTPHLVADVYVHRDGKPIMAISDLGIRLAPAPGTGYRPGSGGKVDRFLGRRNRHGEPAMLNELHLAHAAKGDLATAMGPEFAVYAGRKAPYIPNGDFLFVDRVMRLDGERGRLDPGAVMVTEYDSPSDAWYYGENAFAGMPNCVHMETSLQAAILLGYYLGATLPTPEQELSIRNLDGTAVVTAGVDLRGRLIRQESTLQSHTTGAGGILQGFQYRLTADGEPFYQGESLFGYFSAEALANQLGLDGGKPAPTWFDRQDPRPEARRLRLRGDPRWHEGDLRLGRGHLDLVDWVDVVPGGGEHGIAYLRGYRHVRPQDWYFDCHFHKDPVMPGSLGIEAMIQALQAYVIDAGLADGIPRPTFSMPVGVAMSWKYRGQILREDPDMPFELHVKQIRRDGDRLQVLADASLWKADLRIYQVTDLAVQVNPRPEEANR
jgi:3-hydroxymyristoyl/3-hydroxydecanoyl-(acyl carrier protein) dehydratase